MEGAANLVSSLDSMNTSLELDGKYLQEECRNR